ncbi:WYL domain-containing protein [Brevibacillus agri]|uniref:WYL domain-containing protein n=1 Tax=Brevibacillus agri TaxID=51101 RepID=UPI003D1AF7D4
MVKELLRAVNQQQDIQIIYIDSTGQTTQRTIRPLTITDARLKAYCYTRKAPRVFIFDRILAVQPAVIRHAV